MTGTTLKAELDSHRQVERERLAAMDRPRGAEDDPLGLRGVVLQARSDAFDLGLQLGANVTAAWALRRMRELIESPAQSFSAFASEVEAEMAELMDSCG